jgi:hypothetical protein
MRPRQRPRPSGHHRRRLHDRDSAALAWAVQTGACQSPEPADRRISGGAFMTTILTTIVPSPGWFAVVRRSSVRWLTCGNVSR